MHFILLFHLLCSCILLSQAIEPQHVNGLEIKSPSTEVVTSYDPVRSTEETTNDRHTDDTFPFLAYSACFANVTFRYGLNPSRTAISVSLKRSSLYNIVHYCEFSDLLRKEGLISIANKPLYAFDAKVAAVKECDVVSNHRPQKIYLYHWMVAGSCRHTTTAQQKLGDVSSDESNDIVLDILNTVDFVDVYSDMMFESLSSCDYNMDLSIVDRTLHTTRLRRVRSHN